MGVQKESKIQSPPDFCNEFPYGFLWSLLKIIFVSCNFGVLEKKFYPVSFDCGKKSFMLP